MVVQVDPDEARCREMQQVLRARALAEREIASCTTLKAERELELVRLRADVAGLRAEVSSAEDVNASRRRYREAHLKSAVLKRIASGKGGTAALGARILSRQAQEQT